MTDCQPDLLRVKNPSKTRVTLCAVARPDGRCRISSDVFVLGSAPAASMSALALTVGAEFRSVRLIRFASHDAAYVYYSGHRQKGSPIRLYVQDHGLWHLQYSCDMPVP